LKYNQLSISIPFTEGVNIVADPASAVKIAFKAGPQFSFPVLASKSLSDKTVLAIALPALCAVINPTPQIGRKKAAF